MTEHSDGDVLMRSVDSGRSACVTDMTNVLFASQKYGTVREHALRGICLAPRGRTFLDQTVLPLGLTETLV